MAKKSAARTLPVGHIHQQLFSTTFNQRAESEIFRCGNYRLSLHKLTRDLDYPFPMSARLLSTVLKANDVLNMRSFFDLGLNGLAALRGVGDSLCAVATIILDDAGFNLAQFCGWAEDETPVRFQTMKTHQKGTETSRKKKYTADRPNLPSDFTGAEAMTH